MAKQDDFVRITLRLPPDLYERLKTASGASSVNADIVDRLEASFAAGEQSDMAIEQKLQQILEKLKEISR